MIKRFSLTCLAVFAATLVSSHAADSAATLQLKYHGEHTEFDDRPFAEGDMSIGAYYDVFDGMGGWRIGLSYAWDLGQKDGVDNPETYVAPDSVLTPEIALLVREGRWQTGVAILIDYIDAEGDTDWGDIYWQFQLGYGIPIGKKIEIGIHAFYTFERIDKILDFDFESMDFAIHASYRW